MSYLKLLTLVSVVSLLTIPVSAKALTVIDQPTISGSTTWTSADSPYILPMPLTISAGVILTLESGTIVKFDGAGRLDVKGEIKAIGIAGDEIIFTTIFDTAYGGDTSMLATTTKPDRFIQNQILTDSTGHFELQHGKLLLNGFATAESDGGDFLVFRPMIENNGGEVSLSDTRLKNALAGGVLNSSGTMELTRAVFQNIPQTAVREIGGTVSISSSMITDSDVGVSMGGGELSIASSTISNSKVGIHVTGGLAVLTDSVLKDIDTHGIREDGGSVSFIHGYISNIKNPGVLVTDGEFAMHKSSILHVGQTETFYSYQDPEVDENGDYVHEAIDLPESGFANYGSLPVSAENNWWGSVDGPDPDNLRGERTSVSTNVQFTPWLLTDNLDTAATTSPQAASSILFLPGISGSRLYEKVLGIENKRWEPSLFSSQSDVKALWLDLAGNSINLIYTKDGEAVSTTDLPGYKVDIYRTFFEQLEELKLSNSIADYKIFPYDWRKSPIDVAEGANDYSNGVRYLSQEIEDLADDSATGKVSVVGHSNGGLVAKALMKKLEREGKADLVDKVILVDSPQLGTPDALAPTLHGDYGKLTGTHGVFVSQENMRNLAHNMPDAYALLPSSEYFAKVSDPIIDLTSAPKLRASAGFTENSISSRTDLATFVTEDVGRSKPASDDVESPNTLSPHLFLGASTLHEYLDRWSPPAGVDVIEVVGWGLDTVKGIRYLEEEKIFCPEFGGPCIPRTMLTHQPLFTQDGDGTVVAASQVLGTDGYYINLPNANPAFNKNWRHADITESVPFQELFTNLVSTSSPTRLPNYVTNTMPHLETSEKRLRIRVLSPVSLEAYDSLGRHTGMIPNPSSDMFAKEEQIPNSYYQEFGEGKYLGLPGEGTATIKMKGLDTGTFTFEITSIGVSSSSVVAYEDIPVTASSSVEVSIIEDNVEQASLILDVDGDGQTDIAISSSTESQTSLVYVRLIKLNVDAMDLGTTTKRQLLAKFSNVERLILKDSKWDYTDDDSDKGDVRKGERVETRILRKLDKIERWTHKQLAKSQVEVKKKNKLNTERLSATQAEAILNELNHLRTLVK